MTVDPRLVQAMLNGAFDNPDPNVSDEERAAMLARERQLAPQRQRIANEGRATDSLFDRLSGARQLGSARNMRTFEGSGATPGDVGFQASMINSAEIDQQREAANPMVDALSPLQADPRRAKLVEALLAQRPAERDPTVASPTLERTFGPRTNSEVSRGRVVHSSDSGPFAGTTASRPDENSPGGFRLDTQYVDPNAKDAALAEIIAKRRAAGQSFDAAQQARRSAAFATRREDAREARKAQTEAVANNPLAGMNPRMLAGMNPRLAEALIGAATATSTANAENKTKRELAGNANAIEQARLAAEERKAQMNDKTTRRGQKLESRERREDREAMTPLRTAQANAATTEAEAKMLAATTDQEKVNLAASESRALKVQADAEKVLRDPQSTPDQKLKARRILDSSSALPEPTAAQVAAVEPVNPYPRTGPLGDIWSGLENSFGFGAGSDEGIRRSREYEAEMERRGKPTKTRSLGRDWNATKEFLMRLLPGY